MRFGPTDRTATRLPLGRVYTGTAVTADSEGRVYLTGGCVDGEISSLVSEYRNGEVVALGDLLSTRNNHTSNWHKNCIYTTGSGHPIEEFDLRTCQSTVIDPENRCLWTVCSCIHADNMFLFCKKTVQAKRIAVLLFALKRREWSEVALPSDFPKNLKLSLCFPMDCRSVVVFGGMREPGQFNADTYVYDAATHKLQRVSFQFEPEAYRPPVLLYRDWLLAVDVVGRRHTVSLTSLQWELRSQFYGAEHWVRRRLGVWCYHHIRKGDSALLRRIPAQLLLEVVLMM